MINELVFVAYEAYLNLRVINNSLLSFSGGKDSTLLLLIITYISNLSNTHVTLIHFNHFWTKKNFFTTKFIFKFAYLLNTELILINPIKSIKTEFTSRVWRKKFNFRISQLKQVENIYLGHTGTDKIETILMNLIRGTSPSGIDNLDCNQIEKKILYFATDENKFKTQTITWKLPVTKDSKFYIYKKLTINKYNKKNLNKIFLKRPLLNIKQKTIEKICFQSKIPNNLDETNFTKKMTRNKLRLLIVPLLKYYLNPQLETKLINFTDQLKSEQIYFDNLIIKYVNLLIQSKQTQILFKKLPKIIKNKIFYILVKKYTVQNISFKDKKY